MGGSISTSHLYDGDAALYILVVMMYYKKQEGDIVNKKDTTIWSW
jgi:hypothetical protein